MNKNSIIKSKKIPNLRIKARKLGLTMPDGIWILPQNFINLRDTSNILYDADYELLIKLFRTSNIQYSLIDENTEQYEKLVNHSFELITIPVMAFTIELLRKNHEIISTALNIVYNFLKKRLHRQLDVDNTIIKTSIIKEIKPHNFKQYCYEGNLDGYKEFLKFVKEDNND